MHAYALPKTWIRHHHIAGAVTIFSGIFIFFGIVGAGYASLNHDRFYRHTVLASVNIGGLTRDEARDKLRTVIQEYEKIFRLQDGHEIFHPTLLELGISIDMDASLENAWQVGRNGPVVSRLQDTTRSAISSNISPLVLKVDEDRMYQQLLELQDSLNRPVENARISIQLPNAQIVSAREGRRLDVLKLEKTLLESVAALEPSTIALPFIITQPTIREEDVAETYTKVSTAIAKPVRVTHQGDVFEIASDTIVSWLNFYERDHPALPERKILSVDLQETMLQSYVDGIASRIETPGIPRKVIPAVYRDEFAAGRVAHVIAREKNSAAIRQAVFSTTDGTFELITKDSIPPDEILAIPEPVRTEGKAIGVDISKQIAYAWLDGELQYFAKVSSGKGGHATPTGEFKVYGKTRDQKMSGADFYLPHIPFILWYNGDYSLHGTYWHNNFGTPMSHGCSNLSVQDAEWFFDFADIGTPVAIFKS